MILACPKCHTKYRLPDAKVKPEGSRVRCSQCGHVFQASPAQDSETPGPGQGREPEAAEASRPESERRSESPDGAGSRPQKPSQPRKGKGRWLLLGVLLLILLGLLAGGAYMYVPQFRAWLPFAPQKEQKAALTQKQAAPQSSVEAIALKDVRQYMVENEVMGRLLVIEGAALNTSKAAKRRIKVQASLFDGQGDKLTQKSFLCGNTASLFQLQVLNKEKLSSVLSSQAGVMANNDHVAPEQKVAFMTVFPDPPSQVAEFSLKVIQALDVQSQ